MTVGNQHRIKAQIPGCPAGAVYAILSLHSGDDYARASTHLQLLLQLSHAKCAWPAFVEDNFVTLQLQFFNDLRQRAAWFDGRPRRASVSGQEDRGAGLPRIAHKPVQCVYQRWHLPGLVGALNQTDLHIENQ